MVIVLYGTTNNCLRFATNYNLQTQLLQLFNIFIFKYYNRRDGYLLAQIIFEHIQAHKNKDHVLERPKSFGTLHINIKCKNCRQSLKQYTK